MSILELVDSLGKGSVVVRGREFAIRFLRESESALLSRLFPRPLPPMTLDDPGRGSRAPKLANHADPAFVRELQEWNRRRYLHEIVLAMDPPLVDLKAIVDSAGRVNALNAAADRLSDLLTEDEVIRIFNEVRALFDEKAEEKVREALYVDLAGVPADQIAELAKSPDNYGTTVLYLDLRVCERYKLKFMDYAQWAEGEKMVLRVQERFRQAEEARK